MEHAQLVGWPGSRKREKKLEAEVSSVQCIVVFGVRPLGHGSIHTHTSPRYEPTNQTTKSCMLCKAT